MSAALPSQLVTAVSVLSAAREERASGALARAIADGRLGAEAAELLSALVYGALRRERRVQLALAELAGDLAEPAAARALVVGAALLEPAPRLDLAAASELCPEVPWARLADADLACIERLAGPARVAHVGSLPEFLAERLVSEYGDQAVALAESLARAAPRALRVNSLKADASEARERLEREGARVTPGAWGKRALRLEGAFNPFTTQAFHDGLFELQDEGSQLACELVAPPPRGLVVDACAGAGGKSLALAAALEGRGKVVSLDVEPQKLAELRRRAKRAGAVNVQALEVTPEGPLPEAVEALRGRVDRLLIDAPCSGTGTLRRNPEARSRLTPAAVERLVVVQRSIIERMLPLVAPGGRLIFVTCSLLRAEGEALLDEVEAAHPELSPVNLAEIYDRAYVERFQRSAPHRLRVLPHLHDTDGFFVTVLRRMRGPGASGAS